MKRVLSNFAFLVLLFLVVSTIYSFAQNVSAMDVHVDKAVAIPGNVLEPGDYVFRRLDRTSREVETAIGSSTHHPTSTRRT
jgi:hypothetical protein